MTGFIILVLIIVGYLLPSLIAEARKHSDKNAICVVNLLLGWTFIGWVVALAWSLTGNKRI